MQNNKGRNVKRSKTKIIPPKKKKTASLSRDEVRSINKRKIRRRRKAKRIAILVFLALSVICAGVVLILAVFFRINTIQIKGSQTYNKKQIITAGDIEEGANLFMVNEEKLNERLPVSLPYIESVTVERELPDKLIINVTETTTVACIKSGKVFVAVDKTGKVLSNNEPKRPVGAAIVRGLDIKSAEVGKVIAFGKQELTDNFLLVVDAIDKSGIQDITSIKCDEKGVFTLVYDKRITIEIGSLTNVVRKLQRAAAAIEQENEINPNGEGTLDLSVEPNAYFDAGAKDDSKKSNNKKNKK